MKEQINKLALQAREHADSLLRKKLPNMVWQDEYNKKFAELIVEECAELMETQHTWITSVAASTLIRNHFKNEKF